MSPEMLSKSFGTLEKPGPWFPIKGCIFRIEQKRLFLVNLFNVPPFQLYYVVNFTFTSIDKSLWLLNN